MTHKDTILTEVLKYWFADLSFKEKFSGDPTIDETIKERFADVHTEVAAGEYGKARTTAQAYLAGVIILDQFSRQLFRNTADAFAHDGHALCLAQEAIARGLDVELTNEEKLFLYMPFMHSESKLIHEEAVSLFESLGMEEPLKYEHIHKDIIDRFGRYPHRNKILGRENTTAETDYLANNHEDFF